MTKEKPEETYYLTTEEAVSMARKTKARTRFAISIRLDTPIIKDGEACSDRYFEDSFGVHSDEHFRDGFSTYVNVSKPTFIEILQRSYMKTLEERGARIFIRITYYNKYPTYWISQ